MPQSEVHKRRPYHPDVTLFFVLIPFISAFNYYLTYSNIQLSWFLLITFSIDTVQGYLAWWGARTYIVYLDKKVPYEPRPLYRIIIQLIGIMIIGLVIISSLTELVSWIAKGKPAPINFYAIDLVIISIWFFVINGIYVGLHYYNRFQQAETDRQEENRLKSGGLVVRQNKHDIKVDFNEIAGFLVEDEYVLACTFAGKKYLLDQSLDKLEKTLPGIFFRLNRQCIVSHQIVAGFKRAENGKLEVMLTKTDKFPEEITVSRMKAPAFRRWFQPS